MAKSEDTEPEGGSELIGDFVRIFLRANRWAEASSRTRSAGRRWDPDWSPEKGVRIRWYLRVDSTGGQDPPFGAFRARCGGQNPPTLAR